MIIGSCSIKLEKAFFTVSTTEKSELKWLSWKPSTFRNEIADIDQRFVATFIKMPSGEFVTYGRKVGTQLEKLVGDIIIVKSSAGASS